MASLKQKMEHMTRSELEALRDEFVRDISPNYINGWSKQAQDGHRRARVRDAVRVEEKLNGPEAAKEFYVKISREYLPQYRKRTEEEKAASDVEGIVNSVLSSQNAEPSLRRRYDRHSQTFLALGGKGKGYAED